MDLSIIIPIYNGEKFLKECLDSVFIKTNSKLKFEVIIIDDGSNDMSSNIYNNYNYENVIIKKTENMGVSHARNLGMEIARR